MHAINLRSFTFSLRWFVRFAFATAWVPFVNAQTTISVTDSTGWNPWTNTSGAIMTDPNHDQQTGQTSDDFVGDATHYGFQQKAGLLGGTTDAMMFRFRLGDYSVSKGGASGNGSNFSIAFDLDNNGTMDLVMDTYSKSNTNYIQFASPGTGANTGPSSTTFGTFAGQITLTASTFNIQATTDGTHLGYGSSGQDEWVTVAISFSDLQNAIRTYAGSSFSGYTVNYTTTMSMIAFTSTQGNAINQDLFGTTGNTSSTSTFASLGTITPPISPYGTTPMPVPEPATYAQLGALLLSAFGLRCWRRSKARVAQSA